MHNYALSKCQMDCQLCYYFLFCVISQYNEGLLVCPPHNDDVNYVTQMSTT